MHTDNLSARQFPHSGEPLQRTQESICGFKEPKTRFLQQIYSHFFALLPYNTGLEVIKLAMQSSVHTTHFDPATGDDSQFPQSVPYPTQQSCQLYGL
ncbi:hypothetical protein NIES4073_30620 [Kalymmatonema gypsitolerans NIES-4073]|nr:hypothetical protein NIES4073_30620 [Scytonema sp. NIES-4073]